MASVGDPLQVSLIVPDLETAMEAWVRHGVGPWNIWNLDSLDVVDSTIGSEPTQVSILVAVTMWGSLEIELVQPVDDVGIWAESLRAHGGKAHLHHLRCDTDDYDATVAQFRDRGRPPVMSGGLGTNRFAYLDTEDDVGTILEISYFEGADMFEKAPPPDAVYPAEP